MPNHKRHLKLVSKLADLMQERKLAEIDYSMVGESGEKIKVRLSRADHVPGQVISPQLRGAGLRAQSSPSHPIGEPLQIHVDEPYGTVLSEMVGTAYLRPSPDAEAPFVSVGSQVKEGDTLLIIEAMKTMNYIQSPYSGTILKILVGDEEPVQFGTALVVIG